MASKERDTRINHMIKCSIQVLFKFFHLVWVFSEMNIAVLQEKSEPYLSYRKTELELTPNSLFFCRI